MDFEENPGLFPIGGASQTRDTRDFEQQLRDIDAAINYPNQSPVTNATFPQVANTIPVSTPFPHIEDIHLPTNQRVILGDITNRALTQQKSPISKSGTKTWKKLARAKGVSTNHAIGSSLSKRPSIFLDEDGESDGEHKKQRNINANIISVEAAQQPRREP
ncbi:hypothetical protein FCV25MIE_18871 [Fagus crenata]